MSVGVTDNRVWSRFALPLDRETGTDGERETKRARAHTHARAVWYARVCA